MSTAKVVNAMLYRLLQDSQTSEISALSYFTLAAGLNLLYKQGLIASPQGGNSVDLRAQG
jgi:hypothetical protein